MNFNTDNWGKFKISDFFSCRRGKRIVKTIDYFEQKNEEYCYPVITSTTYNNSIDGYYNRANSRGHVICCGGEASGMFATYQETPCWIMDRSRELIPKRDFSKNIMLFFATLFKMEMYRYHYQRSANPDMILNTDIKLPIRDDGSPDFELIESFMSEIYKKRQKRIISTNNDYKFALNTEKWKWFEVGLIFLKKKIKKINKIPDSIGRNEFISSTSICNGVSKCCDEKTIASNCITVSTNGDCFDAFYHEDRIVVSSDVEVLQNSKLNKYNGLFICTILKCEKFRWTYRRKPKNDKVFSTKIKLPCKNDQPDWEYMESIIKLLPNGDLI